MAETPPPGGALADVVRMVLPFVPGAAGAVLGMVFGEGLTVRGRLVSIVTGLACVFWVAPAIVLAIEYFLFGGQPLPTQLTVLVGFLTGTFGMVTLSGLAQALARYSRDPLGLVRIQAGPVTIGGNNDGALK
ncbi:MULTISPECIES: hypothetical protein [unclassified Brevundimonas]|uniref:hypothetical protein n=1 Tax=unclassified Brevundimonas TaxID=2622653 RepID=UPI0025C39F8D|nr:MULTISPECIES: hypothetical protein [unclassified Brevundimonas]